MKVLFLVTDTGLEEIINFASNPSNRNGDKIASAYTEAETKKATIRLLRSVMIFE